MRYSDDIVEEVRSRNDIVDVIGSYVKLTKKGNSYFGLCPFHNEKSPSFSVAPHKQMFYCFGCGKGGNVFSFLMEYENLTFKEAVKVLGDRAGVALPEVELSGEEKRQNDLKNSILEINTEAAKYYHYLLGTPVGERAKAYFEKRRLTPETVTSFGLGATPAKSDGLYQYMKKKGYPDQLLKETGLFVFNERGVRDMFYNRCMFPILNMNRKVIGFGGRVMGDGEPKYLNTNETPVFHKGSNLFAMHVARNSRRNNFIICEGYMDVISMHQAGFTQAVASLGTAFTEKQAMLMKRYVKDVLVCYDSDEAGVKAALRNIEIMKRVGLNTKVINMRPYKDADEFLKAEGAEAFQKRIDEAENSFLYRIRMMERNFDMTDPTEKTNFFWAVAKTLLEFEEEIERNSYLEAIAASYEISARSLKELVVKLASQGVPMPAPAKDPQPKNRDKDDGLRKAQRMVLTWLADDPALYGKLKPYLSAEDFTEEMYRQVAGIMFSELDSGSFDPAAILNHFEDETVHSEVARILNTELMEDGAEARERERALNEAVFLIRKNSLEERSRSAPDLATLQQIVKEKAALKDIHISLSGMTGQSG